MCKCKLAITLSEEIMIVGRKKDGDGKGNKWNEVNMKILEVSLYRGLLELVTFQIISRMNRCGVWMHLAFEHCVAHELYVTYGICHAWVIMSRMNCMSRMVYVTHESLCHAEDCWSLSRFKLCHVWDSHAWQKNCISSVCHVWGSHTWQRKLILSLLPHAPHSLRD